MDAILERRIGAETVVYDAATHRAYCLGPVASAVWRSWKPGASFSRIASQVAAEIGEPVEPMAVALALRRLERAGLQRLTPALQGDEMRGRIGPAAGRRAALRRVAALAGLTVAALAVPVPEAVACSVQAGQPCQSSSQCCPNAAGNPTCCGQLLRRCLPIGIANCGP
jgi:hypothetical protein